VAPTSTGIRTTPIGAPSIPDGKNCGLLRARVANLTM
jgi:hypothetical protein